MARGEQSGGFRRGGRQSPDRGRNGQRPGGKKILEPKKSIVHISANKQKGNMGGV